MEELLDVTELLTSQPLPAGRRVAIVGNAGGCGVLTADACESQGLEVPELADETQDRLLQVASRGAAVANPIDLAASAPGAEYRSVLEIVLAGDDVDAVIVTFSPVMRAEPDGVAEAVGAVAAAAKKPVLANFVLGVETAPALREGPGSPPRFAYPESAAQALAHVARYAEWRRRPEGTAPAFTDLDTDVCPSDRGDGPHGRQCGRRVSGDERGCRRPRAAKPIRGLRVARHKSLCRAP